MERYLVGGALRDEWLGLSVSDRDWVVVGASPEDMVARGYKPVGRDFPVFLDPETHEEHALARTERKSGRGYHGFVFHTGPDVRLEDDLTRRDLTINAIARAENGTVVDPCGGRADLEARVLRHVSPAFVEDPVRLLRLARYYARFAPLGFRVADETMALLREMFGSSVERLRVEQRTFKVGASATPVDLTLVCSSHHIELNPSDAGTRDRDVVQEVIKEIAQSASVVAGAGPAFKVVVLNEVERMSKPAQHALRRTMEKCAAARNSARNSSGRRAQFSARNSPSLRHPSRYTATCRLLLVCTNPCKVIAPIRSRCLCLRVAAPTVEEVSSVLLAVAHKEGVKCPPALAERIARDTYVSILDVGHACDATQTTPLWEERDVSLGAEIRALGELCLDPRRGGRADRCRPVGGA